MSPLRGLIVGFGLTAAVVVAGPFACTDVPAEFACEDDAACVLDGELGHCEPNDRCSFDDAACGTGRRFGEAAGASSNACVAPWSLQLAGPFDEAAPRLALDRSGQLHAVTSFADRIDVADRSAIAIGGTDVLHVEVSAVTGRVSIVEALGGPGDDAPAGLERWGQDAIVLAVVAGEDARLFDEPVSKRGSLVARRGDAPWSTAIPIETGETRALAVEAQAVDGAGTIVVSGDAFGGPLDFGGGVVLEEAPAGFGGFVATFSGEGAPKTAYDVRLEGGATEACAAIATDGDRRFATSCTGYFPDEAGAVDFEFGYPLLVIGSTYDGFPIAFAALPATTAVTVVAFGLEGSLIVGGYFYDATILPPSLETGEEVVLEAVGEADGFIARLYVEIGGEEVAFATGSVTQLGGPNSGVFPLALEAEEDGMLQVVGGYFGSVEPFGVSAGGVDGFVFSLAVDGSLAGAKRVGGALDDIATAIAVGPSGQAFLGGTFQGEIDIDGVTLRSAGGTDAFVIPLAPK